MTRNYSDGNLSSKFLPNFTSFQNNISSYYYHEPISHARIIPMVTFSPSVSCDNSSTPDEADENNQKTIINERKRRRMVSNRESAKRSRMRKQRQLEELCSHVTRLRSENHGLMLKLNQFLESHEEVVQENDKLKKEALELRKLLSEAQLASTYASLDLGIFRDVFVDDDDIDDDDDSYAREIVPTSCSTVHRRAQSSHKFTVASTTSDSSTLLH